MSVYSNSQFILEKCQSGVFFMVKTFSDFDGEYDGMEGAINLDSTTFKALVDNVINGRDFETRELSIKFLNGKTILIKIEDSFGLVSKTSMIPEFLEIFKNLDYQGS